MIKYIVLALSLLSFNSNASEIKWKFYCEFKEDTADYYRAGKIYPLKIGYPYEVDFDCAKQLFLVESLNNNIMVSLGYDIDSRFIHKIKIIYATKQVDGKTYRCHLYPADYKKYFIEDTYQKAK